MNAVAEQTKPAVSAKRLAKMLHFAINPGRLYDVHAQYGWLIKIPGFLASDRTVDGIIAAWVNYPWMVDGAQASKEWRRNAEKIIAILNSVEVVS